MRTFALSVVLFLASAAAVAVPGRAAAAGPSTDFISWALDRSSECDIRWSRITEGCDATIATASGREGPARDEPLSSERVIPGMKLSHDVITTRSFIHKRSRNDEYLPLSTRERNSASRGVSTLRSPANAHLVVPHSARRPFNSSIQQKNFFRDFGTSISRPRLDSFGRMSKAHRLGNGAVSRPAYRATRPRVL